MQHYLTRDDLITVAKLYYLGNKTQNEISDILGVSRQKVARMLALARERKIIEFRINSSALYLEQMGEKIQKEFRLKKVVVTPCTYSKSDDVLEMIKVVKDYLDKTLHDNMNIGLSFSTTVDEFVKHYTSKTRINNASVIQILGGTLIEQGSTDARQIIQEFAKKIGAVPKILQAPLVVHNSLLKSLLLQEPEISAHFELFNHLDLAIISFGSDRPDESLLYKAGYINHVESASLIEQGLTADICARRFTADGELAVTPLNDRIIGIEIATLKKIPVIMGLGFGNERAPSIIAAAKAGLVNILFLDESAAVSVISQANI